MGTHPIFTVFWGVPFEALFEHPLIHVYRLKGGQNVLRVSRSKVRTLFFEPLRRPGVGIYRKGPLLCTEHAFVASKIAHEPTQKDRHPVAHFTPPFRNVKPH